MDLQQRINAFVQLGRFLSQFTREDIVQKDDVAHNDLFFDGMLHQIKIAGENNGWFTKENVLFALEGWAQTLTQKGLELWLAPYEQDLALAQKNNTTTTANTATSSKTVAVIMAGNIPLVGFHDFLSVLMSGHRFVGKLSSNDKHLLPFLAMYLEKVAPSFKGRITFTDDKLLHYDAVIATGSDNTARYFEYYFGDKPNIIRKNRNSVAVLTGDETETELEALTEDIFRYYGLGCRNVSKLFVPKGYNFDAFFNAVYAWRAIIHQNKYANNYDYNKAVYLMSLFELKENGFLMLKEETSYGSPIATLFYEYYDELTQLSQRLDKDQQYIQCVVTNEETATSLSRKPSFVAYGQTQKPALNDYADGVDTIAFLLRI
ncbi:MAG: acyl-CoA reductase [Dokdonia sp.]|jgi:hypothetical protein